MKDGLKENSHNKISWPCIAYTEIDVQTNKYIMKHRNWTETYQWQWTLHTNHKQKLWGQKNKKGGPLIQVFLLQSTQGSKTNQSKTLQIENNPSTKHRKLICCCSKPFIFHTAQVWKFWCPSRAQTKISYKRHLCYLLSRSSCFFFLWACS